MVHMGFIVWWTHAFLVPLSAYEFFTRHVVLEFTCVGLFVLIKNSRFCDEVKFFPGPTLGWSGTWPCGSTTHRHPAAAAEREVRLSPNRSHCEEEEQAEQP